VPLSRRPGLLLGTLGVLFGSVSLAFPFGRDQGLYYYVAREWLRHGAMPYRDLLEQKTPGIYAVHAVAITLLGDRMSSIRVLELACVVGLGLVCARLATPRGDDVPAGLGGVSVLAASLLYFGFHDFWNTGQCEIWCTTAAMASACAAAHLGGQRRAPIVAGLLAGAARVFKPPGAGLVALALGVALARAWRDSPDSPRRMRDTARAALLFVAGAAAPIALLVAYFAARGALPAAIDVLVGANGWYLQHERGVESLGDVLRRTQGIYKWYDPLSSLLLEAAVVALVVGALRRDRVLRDRHAVALAACALGFLGVLVQLKFYLYHWGLLVGPATLVVANVGLDVVALVRWRAPDRGDALACALFAGNLVLAYGLTGRAANHWGEEAAATASWLAGRTDGDAFAATFDSPEVDYPFRAARQVSAWLREHTDASDQVAVRGFDPEIYAMAHRRIGGRFFWTMFLTDPRRAYRRDEWLREDRASLEREAPRWVVTEWDAVAPPDAPSTFTAMGYVERMRVEPFVVLERAGR
jgi:hypothetical protein